MLRRALHRVRVLREHPLPPFVKEQPIADPMEQIPHVARKASLFTHGHRGIQQWAISQGAQESDGIE